MPSYISIGFLMEKRIFNCLPIWRTIRLIHETREKCNKYERILYEKL